MRTLAMMIVVLLPYLGGCISRPGYFISIGHPPGYTVADPGSPSAKVSEDPFICTSTVPLDEVVMKAVTGGEGDDTVKLFKDIRQKQSEKGANDWNIRRLQIVFERTLDRALDNVPEECRQPRLRHVSKKWLQVYSLGATDPDQDLERLREYLISMRLVRMLAEEVQAKADEQENGGKTKKTAFLQFREEETDVRSQWCGKPRSADCPWSEHRLYKVFSTLNENYVTIHKIVGPPIDGTEDQQIDSVLLRRIEEIIAKNDRHTRFFVLGYDMPLDEERSLVRYGVTFYFEDRPALLQERNNRGPETELIGYTLLYANEATPKPREELSALKARVPTECQEVHNRDRELEWRERVMYAAGYPFALAIGLKNATFEITKMPFSPIAGLLFGRGSSIDYPLENLRTAWDAFIVEATQLPNYSLLPGLYNLITETPLIGYLVQFNTGPEHPDFDLPSGIVRRKLFLSRGIYGGDKWGQDTGLWASFAQAAYPTYDVYSPPYRHGTVIDVVWSMFNLSHGPGYSEAKYVMDQDVSHYDHLYLTGHSGGVQRSASASRILANHGYTVVKILGIAGPSIGQAYVDTRYPNSFRILLNTQTGANQDIVSKVGMVASGFSTLLDWSVLGAPKYTLGGLAGLHSEKSKREVYAFVDRLGYSNSTPTEVDRKPSTEHHTPLRQSLAEPVVFDAYVRSEFASAFREDLERPDPIRIHPPRVSDWASERAAKDDLCLRTNRSKSDPDEGKGAFRWSR